MASLQLVVVGGRWGSGERVTDGPGDPCGAWGWGCLGEPERRRSLWFPLSCDRWRGARVPALLGAVNTARGDRLPSLVGRVTYAGDDRQVVVRSGLVLDRGGEGVVVSLPVVAAILEV